MSIAAITTAAKNGMLEALRPGGTASGLEFKYYGLHERGTAKAVTSESKELIKLTGSLAENTIVTFTAVVGGKSAVSGQSLIAGRIFYVVEPGSNNFKLSETKSGPAISWPEEEVKTGSELAVLKECEYGTGGRVETKPAAAANGSMEDSTARGLKPKKGAVVNVITCWSTVTTGTLMAAAEVTEESFGTEGATYTVTSGAYNLMAGQ